MRKLRALMIRLAGLFRRSDREMEEEFRAHLAMQVEDNLRAGMSPEEARRAALIKSGGIQAARENYREQRGLPFLETLIQDVRYGARLLRKSPGFTFVAVLTLALGIGANTAIFSVVNAVLFESLPAADPDRLVQLWETEVSPGTYPFAGPDYLDWQAQNHTLEATTLYFGPRPTNGTHNGESQPLMVMNTEANYFAVLGVKAQMGRVFAAGEDQAANRHVAVLSYGYWQKSFGGQDDVINKTVELNDEKYTIIGVMPSWCRFPLRADIFVPLDMSEKALGPRGNHSYRAIGRLKKSVTPAQARADLATIAARLEKQFPGTNNKVGPVVVPLAQQIRGDSKPGLLLLLAAVGAVLLLACANVANLLLAKATSRQKEMSLRAVLGASRSRVVRQLLTESLLLSLGGGLIGLAGGFWLVRLIESSSQLPIPRHNPVQIDTTVLIFTFGLSVLVGIVFGLAPVFQAARLDLGEELKSTAQSVGNSSRLARGVRDGLVVFELGVSLALLIVAGLLLRSFARLNHAEIGIDPDHVVTGSIMLPDSRYSTMEARRQFCDRLLHHVQAMPEVRAAGLSTVIPLEGGWNGTIEVPGDTNPAHGSQLVEFNYITPGYFQAMAIPVRRGAIFSEHDMDRAAEVSHKVDELIKKNPDISSLPPEISFD
ncbi:MAG TPA: ABC transporter permease, partial [Candidatus Limnocylindrales bacterium]|nr:ABC transporter permease [Candidatus Limnocylindrales bacterium]